MRNDVVRLHKRLQHRPQESAEDDSVIPGEALAQSVLQPCRQDKRENGNHHDCVSIAQDTDADPCSGPTAPAGHEKSIQPLVFQSGRRRRVVLFALRSFALIVKPEAVLKKVDRT